MVLDAVAFYSYQLDMIVLYKEGRSSSYAYTILIFGADMETD